MKWEYLVLTLDVHANTWSLERCAGMPLEQALDLIGGEGWELVTTTVESRFEGSDWSGKTSEIDYIFKRPRS